MMLKKYELIESDKDGLFRVKALRDFGDVKAGELGGYVAGERNLSHDGNAWVSDNARVRGNAWVYGDAHVRGNAQVHGNARVYGDARVSDNAMVSGCAQVYDNAQVYGNARVYGDARVSDNAMVSGCAQVYDNAQVYGNARVSGNARVTDNAMVSGCAVVSDNAQVRGDAVISDRSDFLVIGPMLSSGRYVTAHKTPTGYQINAGCYSTDSVTKFAKRVREVHSGENLSSYLVAVSAIRAWVKWSITKC